MSSATRVQLGPKNESIFVRRNGFECEIDCILDRESRRWDVYLDQKCLVNGQVRPLSPAERREVLPVVEKYLSRVWWLGFFPKNYAVRFHEAIDA
jgi:hypothetical protein